MKRKLKKHTQEASNTSPFVVVSSISLLCIITLCFTQKSEAFSFSSIVTFVKQQWQKSQLNDSVKVLTQQESVNASTLADNKLKTAQTLLSVESALKTKQSYIDIYQNFIGPDSATSSSRCYQVTARKNEVDIPLKVKQYITSEAFYIGNSINLLTGFEKDQQIVKQKFNNLCSISLSQQGFCTPILSDAINFDTDLTLATSEKRISKTQLEAGKLGILTIADSTRDLDTSHNCSQENSSCLKQTAGESNRVSINSLVSYSLLNQLYSRIPVGTPYES